MTQDSMRIGFIPLVDAAALVVAVDNGFAAAEGLAIELTREVSWSNVRDKLNIGVFDAAHLLAPLAIASSLGIGHVKVPLLAPFMLGVNGNAITLSPQLYDELAAAADGDLADPMISAHALGSVAAKRRHSGGEPLTFGMTFPFSTHNYLIRSWMAAGGIDPDEDVRLVVLPPPYMVDSLASHQVDGFCVGAPWNSVAVKLGIGRIIHFGRDIVARAPEKVLAVRAAWAADRGGALERLLRALGRAADFVNDPAHQDEAVALLAAANRLDVAPDLIRATLNGRLPVALGGNPRLCPEYILMGRDGAARPEPVHAAWLYAQMVRWHQTALSPDLLAAAEACFRPDLYDSALGSQVGATSPHRPLDGVGAFAGPPFDPNDIAAYVRASRAHD
jgi:NitT/TauT family transport system ATP-binding protein